MESFMSAAMLTEFTLLSFLMALWMIWLGLSGLFRLLPATNQDAPHIKLIANPRAASNSRHAA